MRVEAPGVVRVEVRRREEAVPHRVHIVGVVGVGGNRLLVVAAGVVDEDRNGGAPAVSAVGRGRHEDAVVAVKDVEHEPDAEQLSIWRERDPWIGCAVEFTAGTLRDPRNRDLVPRLAPIVCRAGDESTVAAVVPAVLVIGADDVPRVRRIDVGPRLGLGVRIERAERFLRCRVVGRAGCERIQPGRHVDDRARECVRARRRCRHAECRECADCECRNSETDRRADPRVRILCGGRHRFSPFL